MMERRTFPGGWVRRVAVLAGAAALVVASCGGDDDAAEPTTTTTPEATTAAPTTAAPTTAAPTTAAPTTVAEGLTFTTFTTADGLASDDVIAVDVGPDGTVWATTVTARGPDGAPTGLSFDRLDGDAWTAHPVDAPITQVVLFAGPGGTAWLQGGGFDADTGLWQFDGTAWVTHYDCTDAGTAAGACPEVPPVITGAGVAPDGSFLGLGFAGGTAERFAAYRYDTSAWTTVEVPDTMSLATPPEAAVSSDGTLWSPTGDGVARMQDGTWTAFPNDQSSTLPIKLWSVGPDGTSVVVAGSIDRLAEGVVPTESASFAGDTWTVYPPDELPLASDSQLDFTKIHMANVAADHLFVSGLGGLIWADVVTDVTTTLTTADGLADDDTRDVASAPDGSVWVATAAGVSRIEL